jgi:hypothetical protein
MAFTTGVVFAQTASADPVPLAHGTYDCYDVDHWIGTLIYSRTSVRLAGQGTYLAGERHVTLTNPVAGRYKIKGNRIVFQSGALKQYYGKIFPSDPWYGSPYFSLYLAKTQRAISRICIASQSTN